MTGYEASQAMRRLETGICEQKGIKAMVQSSGDPSAVRECNARIKRYQAKYAEISDITGIAQDRKRMMMTKSDKAVDNSAKSSIIKNIKPKQGVQDVHYIGKIDKNIYQKVTDKKILTDDVIITDNRIQHIVERRGQEFYDKYREYFKEIVANPDYIFKDKNDNTVIACKTFKTEKSSVNIVLRLVVEGDNTDYKNSIITAIKESDKRFEQRLRNSEFLYKKLDKE